MKFDEFSQGLSAAAAYGAQAKLDTQRAMQAEADRRLSRQMTKGYRATPVPSYTKGGPVRGPGTSTSDSIDAKLSNKEYVLTPAMIEALGGTKRLEALRAQTMKPGFALGGPVSRTDEEVARKRHPLSAAAGYGQALRGVLTLPQTLGSAAMAAAYPTIDNAVENVSAAGRSVATVGRDFMSGLTGEAMNQPPPPPTVVPRQSANPLAPGNYGMADRGAGYTANAAPTPPSVNAPTGRPAPGTKTAEPMVYGPTPTDTVSGNGGGTTFGLDRPSAQQFLKNATEQAASNAADGRPEDSADLRRSVPVPGTGYRGDVSDLLAANLSFELAKGKPDTKRITALMEAQSSLQAQQEGTALQAANNQGIGLSAGAARERAGAGLAGAQTQDLANTTQGRIEGMRASSQQSLAHASLLGAQAQETNTLAPARLDALRAGIGKTQAETGLTQVEMAFKQAGIPIINTQAASAQLSVDAQQRLAALNEQFAKTNDPKMRAQIADQIMLSHGQDPKKGGYILADVDTGTTDMTGNPVFKKLPFNVSTGQFVQQAVNNAPSEKSFIEAAKKVNKGMTDAQLSAKYRELYSNIAK